MGIIGLFAVFVMVIAGFVLLTGFVGLAAVLVVFVRQKVREQKEHRE